MSPIEIPRSWSDATAEMSPVILGMAAGIFLGDLMHRGARRPVAFTLGCIGVAAAAPFLVEAVKDRNNRGDEFWNFKFTMAGLVSDEAEFEKYRATYEAFKAMGLRIKDIEGLQDEPVEPTESGKF